MASRREISSLAIKRRKMQTIASSAQDESERMIRDYAAGLILMLNDKQVPPLGRDGQVIKNRVFDRTSLEKLQ